MSNILNPMRAETAVDMRTRMANLMIAEQWQEVDSAYQSFLRKMVAASYHPNLDAEHFDDEIIKRSMQLLLLSPRLDGVVFVKDQRQSEGAPL